MNIGIDLSPLQGPHRMRGIGATLFNYLNNLSDEEKKKNHYIFFVFTNADVLFKDALELINTKGLDYETRTLGSLRRIEVSPRVPKPIRMLTLGPVNGLIKVKDYYLGDSRIKSVKNIDTYIQFDQSEPLIRGGGIKKILIAYDLIPYILDWDYLVKYTTARSDGRSRLGALRQQLKRYLYIKTIRLNVRRANHIIVISNTTKQDFIRFARAKAKKITVIPLGISKDLPVSAIDVKPELNHYITTSWGFMKKPLKFDTPFLLYVGGTDPRRKLEDLISSFNMLRASGHDLKLVLVGDIMYGPNAITNLAVQKALKVSSYLDDIVFMGFVNDNTRDWLYKHALVFVFPSRYEGFGLPVLEAMRYGTPIISHMNQATYEIADNTIYYSKNFLETADLIVSLLSNPKGSRILSQKAKKIALKFTWDKTADAISNVCKL